MVSFSLRNEYFSRLMSYNIMTSESRSDPRSYFELKLSDDNVHIPIDFGVMISTVLFNIINTDSTISSINLDSIITFKFRNPSNSEIILRLLSDIEDQANELSDEDILDFFEFGCEFGCPLFMVPFIEKHSNPQNHQEDSAMSLSSSQPQINRNLNSQTRTKAA